MTVPVLTFFSMRDGIGTTSLIHHLAWMLSDLGHSLLVCDLDPRANLTASFLSLDELARLWDDESARPNTIHRCVRPLTHGETVQPPELWAVANGLHLIPGDAALAGFEEFLAEQWVERTTPDLITCFWTAMQRGAKQCKASLILVDTGPGLGAIEHSIAVSTDHMLLTVSPDIFSLRRLATVGPVLRLWRANWEAHRNRTAVPAGTMAPIGYVVGKKNIDDQPAGGVVEPWMERLSSEFARHMTEMGKQTRNPTNASDPQCLAIMHRYWSLSRIGRAKHKPIFHLTAADGAIGVHSTAVRQAGAQYRTLANMIIDRIGLSRA